MTNSGQIREILSLYNKHGWSLRRVLLSERLEKRLAAEADTLFGTAEQISSDIDAAWFARSSRHNHEAWELRHLSETPFALFEAFGEDTAEADREAKRREIEDRLRMMLARKTN